MSLSVLVHELDVEEHLSELPLGSTPTLPPQ